MSNPTTLHFDSDALQHNVRQVRWYAPHQKIIAMVKSNAYGSGIEKTVPVLKPLIEAFGVTCIDEAATIRKLSHDSRCILFHGPYNPGELEVVSQLQVECVIHQPLQLQWILAHPSPSPMKIWIKINTGMNRLGFHPADVSAVMSALSSCSWVAKDIGLITHLAFADEPQHPTNQKQIDCFKQVAGDYPTCETSIANSAAVIALPHAHADFVRPGSMLYGIAPFENRIGKEFGLKAVIRLCSSIITVYDYPANTPIGYGGIWQSDTPCRIGVVPIGYGDGYPRHICPGTCVWIGGKEVPIVGRVSMDLLTINLTNYPELGFGDAVELWGPNMPIERIARAAGTIGLELACQVTRRVARS